jgi:predicted RNase H-like nuclease (RuvC/YqgF family)
VPVITETEGDQNPPPSPTPLAKAKENEQAEIKERLDIIQSNITTFNERKNSYLKQKNAAQEVKVNAEVRIEKYRADSYMTSEDRKQSIASEERKINDAETKIREADRQIGSLEEMIGNQESIRNNLEDKLRQQ